MFTVEDKLKVLRAGDVLTDAGPFRRGQSWPMFPLLCGTSGLEERRGGDGWLKREGVDLFPSGRRASGGIRFWAYKEEGEEVMWPAPYHSTISLIATLRIHR